MSQDSHNLINIGEQTGALDASNCFKSEIEGIHQSAESEVNPAVYNKSIKEETTEPNIYESRYIPQATKEEKFDLIKDIDKDYENETVTIIGGQGISGIPVEGDIMSNHGGVTYQIRKKKL